MADPTVKITINKPVEQEEIEAKVERSALIDSWILNGLGLKCAKCHMDFKDLQSVAVLTKHNGIRFLHTGCFDRILLY